MRLTLILILLLLAAIMVMAQKEKTSQPLFTENGLLHLEVVSNYNRVLEDVDADPQDHKAKIIYTAENGNRVRVEAELETRGNFRKNPENCDFPPLEVDFDGDYENTVFKGQKKLKLVTHCRDTLPGAKQNVLKEYLIYRIFNVLTDYSFRVRLCNITYRQSWSLNKRNTLAFFIEDNKAMAARHGARELDNDDDYLPVDTLEWTRLAFFQYMIGNTDWSVFPLQNTEVIKKDKQAAIPVPYDFDLSAFVHTVYAPKALFIAPEELAERHYKGPGISEEDYLKLKSDFISVKDKIFELVENETLLEELERKRLIIYLKSFYEELESDALKDQVVSTR